jgi:hypothetical protein
MSTLNVANILNPTSSGSPVTNIAMDTSGNVSLGAGLTVPGATVLNGSFKPPYSFIRNRIINGNMTFDQRNEGAVITATTTATVTYVLDRWAYYISAGSKFSMARYAMSPVTPVSYQLQYYLGVISLSAYTPGTSDYFAVEQPIEGYNVSDLGWGTTNAESVTLSFYVFSSISGTHSGALTNSARNRSYPFVFNVDSPGVWQRVSVTIPGDTTGTWLTTNGAGIRVRFNMGAGSSFLGAASTWASANYVGATSSVNVVATSAATFYVSGVQFEDGTVATPYEENLYSHELLSNQRYYQKSFAQGTAPAQNAGLVGAVTFGQIVAASTAMAAGPIQLRPTMRATPTTITFYNPSAANAQARNITVPADFTVTTAVNSGETGFGFTATTAAATAAGNQCAVHYTVDAEIV